MIFESFYTDQKDDRGRPYTLSRLSTEDYVRHPWFEPHGCAIRNAAGNEDRTIWLPANMLKHAFGLIDWNNTACLCHHAQFDGLILSHVFGIKPRFWFDTLSMARLLLGNHLSVRLDALAKHFGLAAKTVPYNLFKGRHWSELSPAVQTMVADGCVHDVELTWQLFRILGKDFPREEYEIVDTTVRMFTEGALRADIDMLAKIWEDENTAKAQRLADLGLLASELQSAEKFATLLRAEGIEPETKDSPSVVDEATGQPKQIYAFAKKDSFMEDLQEHENERVRALAEARLGEKSTQLQTRAETFGFMAGRGPMCVYLSCYGAHTTRWSGGDGANWQNLRRDDPDNPGQASPLRRAIMAPEGFWLGIVDLAQIECRILCWLAGQEDYLQKFRDGVDPYIGMASKAYKRLITKLMKQERGTGKQLVLSCGFQAGAETIVKTAELGIYGPPVKIDRETGLEWRDAYREEFHAVVDYWKTAGRMLSRIAGGEPLRWGPMQIRNKRIYGPGGTMLKYDTLEFHKPASDEDVAKEMDRGGFWRYRVRKGRNLVWTKIYSGKLTENVVQWLARIVMAQAMIRIRRLGYKILTTTHDELLLLIPRDGKEEQHLEICKTEMRRTPDWLPGLPLDCEGSLSERYSK